MFNKTTRHHAISLSLLLVVIFLAVGLSFAIAEFVLYDAWWQDKIASGGYLAVLLFAFVASMNIILPIPAVTFTPVFLTAGLSLLPIATALTLGTLLADLVAYIFGHYSAQGVARKYPRFSKKLTTYTITHKKLIIPLVFIYAAFVPIPNEVIVIPLALAKVPLKKIFLPLLLGNLLNQTLLAYATTQAFWWWL